MYVIERTTDRGGKPVYVTKSGTNHAYSPHLEFARTFYLYTDAEKFRCPEHHVVAVDQILKPQ